MYQNVRGLRTKLYDVISNFPIINYDIFILTETWLSSDIMDAELGFTGFTIFRANININTSTCTRGGGVLIAVRRTLCPSLLCCAAQSVEQLFIKLSVSKKNILLIGGEYIPPSASSRFTRHMLILLMNCGNLLGVIWELYMVTSIYQIQIGLIVFREFHYQVVLMRISRQ